MLISSQVLKHSAPSCKGWMSLPLEDCKPNAGLFVIWMKTWVGNSVGMGRLAYRGICRSPSGCVINLGYWHVASRTSWWGVPMNMQFCCTHLSGKVSVPGASGWYLNHKTNNVPWVESCLAAQRYGNLNGTGFGKSIKNCNCCIVGKVWIDSNSSKIYQLTDLNVRGLVGLCRCEVA